MKKQRYVKIRSRNISAAQLRKQIPCKIPTVLRLGSITPIENIFSKNIVDNGNYIEINTVDGCIASGNKILMKQKFTEFEIPTAKWFIANEFLEQCKQDESQLKFPVILKHKHSSRGNGLFYCKDIVDFENVCENIQTNNYIVEEYKTYSREYRVHASVKEGVFIANRKMLRNDAEVRWHRHHENSVWINEDNPMFDKPTNWDEICHEAARAIHAVGLDIGCVDIKVQNSRHEVPEFIILETNSAPALGEDSAQKYIEHIKLLLEYGK